jgi:hypothetical protein
VSEAKRGKIIGKWNTSSFAANFRICIQRSIARRIKIAYIIKQGRSKKKKKKELEIEKYLSVIDFRDDIAPPPIIQSFFLQNLAPFLASK